MDKGSSEQFLTLHEFVKEAKKHLNANVWDYLVGATETETTMRRNRLALDQIALGHGASPSISAKTCLAILRAWFAAGTPA